MDAKLILIVDDDAGFAAICSQVLEDGGCRVMRAANGSEAWQIVEQHKPDLVLADLFIPQDSEFSLFKKIQAQAAQTAVLGMTSCAAAGREAYTVAVQKYGVDTVFAKPFKWSTFLEVVTQKLGDAVEKPRHQYKIMVVDDNEAIHDSLRSIFCPLATGEADLHKLFEEEAPTNSSLSFDVECFSDAAVAIEKLDEVAPDIILMDVSLPGPFDGIEAGRRIRRRDEVVPIIFCSAFTSISWESIKRQLGFACNNYDLAKPFGVAEVKAKVGEILNLDMTLFD